MPFGEHVELVRMRASRVDANDSRNITSVDRDRVVRSSSFVGASLWCEKF